MCERDGRRECIKSVSFTGPAPCLYDRVPGGADAIEGQQLTRVVGALILQEADKIRAMVRDARTS